MNGGKDMYLWINGMRLAGAAKKDGIWPAVFEIISHECVHLTRQILTRTILKNKGIKTIGLPLPPDCINSHVMGYFLP